MMDWELYMQLLTVGPAVGGAYIPGMYEPNMSLLNLLTGGAL
jgi:hypothetical protein